LQTEMASARPGTSSRSRGTMSLSAGRRINSTETQFLAHRTLAGK
jgi:hypothetical protein